MTGIISAIIAGAVTLIGVLIANGKSQAVTDTKLEELTREVREHNNFARRVPILEEQMKVANHRIADLEMIVGSLLTYTTSPTELTDALERLLKPLKVFKIVG